MILCCQMMADNLYTNVNTLALTRLDSSFFVVKSFKAVCCGSPSGYYEAVPDTCGPVEQKIENKRVRDEVYYITYCDTINLGEVQCNCG